MIKYEYKMLHYASTARLMKEVEKKISEGWQTFGSPFFGVEKEQPQFFQAVMKINSFGK